MSDTTITLDSVLEENRRLRGQLDAAKREAERLNALQKYDAAEAAKWMRRKDDTILRLRAKLRNWEKKEHGIRPDLGA
jgi:hypothetical protein